MTKLTPLIALCAALGASGASHAALIDRGGGLVYDDVLNITWLQDANYARTSGYDNDGLMTWQQANTWASELVFGGYSDWRLPSTPLFDTSCNEQFAYGSHGYGCRNSEYGHMFYVNLDNPPGSSYFNTSPPELALFNNIHLGVYWSESQFDFDPTGAWAFSFAGGHRGIYLKSHEFAAWAVRDGDVYAPVPEPETYAMLLAGIGLLSFTAKRRKQSA